MTGPVEIVLAFVAVAIVVVALVFAWQGGRGRWRISPVSAIALALVVTGMVYPGDKLADYLFVGAGVTLAVADILVRSWRQE